MEKIIEVSHLNKEYGSRGAVCKALCEVNFSIDEGEFVAIMGPSGSGKTTLLNAMSTIDRPTSGEIIINKVNINKLKKNYTAEFRRKNIGFVFQDFNLLDNMSIADNIALPLTLNNVNRKSITQEVEKLALILGIESQLNKYPYQLSGGQKQRAVVARALINSPKVLFADEPTGALDSKATDDLLNCFKNVRKTYNTTIVMVTHDPGAASYCDRVLFIKDGKNNGMLCNSGDIKVFFKQILHTISVLGGNEYERF